MFNMEKD